MTEPIYVCPECDSDRVTTEHHDGGPKENNMNFCHCCGKTLRIKGKEAGNVE